MIHRYPIGRNKIDMAINDAVAFRIFCIAWISLVHGWGSKEMLFWERHWINGFDTARLSKMVVQWDDYPHFVIVAPKYHNAKHYLRLHGQNPQRWKIITSDEDVYRRLRGVQFHRRRDSFINLGAYELSPEGRGVLIACGFPI